MTTSVTIAGKAGQSAFNSPFTPTSVTVGGSPVTFAAVPGGFTVSPALAADATVVASGVALGAGGGGVAVTGPLTDAQLRASSVPTLPAMAAGANVSLTTNATGSNFQGFGSQACKQVTIVNDTGTKLDVRQDGGGALLRLPDGAIYTFFGLTNLNQLQVRRTDQSNTQVVVSGRWEA